MFEEHGPPSDSLLKLQTKLSKWPLYSVSSLFSHDPEGDEMTLVVKSAVRTRLKGMRASGDFFKALDKHLADELAKAIARAKANGRKTLRPEDL
jgi:hypothetical protein